MQANLKYSKVLTEIKPLTDELAGLTASLHAGAQRLAECEQELVVLDARKVELQGNLTQRTEEAAELKVCASVLRILRVLRVPLFCELVRTAFTVGVDDVVRAALERRSAVLGRGHRVCARGRTLLQRKATLCSGTTS